MNEHPANPQGKGVILWRMKWSLVLGVSLTVILGLLGNLFPFRVAKFLFWPALLFVRVYGDDPVAATYYYLIGVPLAIAAYSLILYGYITLKGLPHPQTKGVAPK